MKVHVESVLDCPPQKIWAALTHSASFLRVIKPIVSVKPLSPSQHPKKWQEDSAVFIKPYLFGLIPMSEKKIYFETIDHDSRFIQTRESDALVKVWDHSISVNPQGEYQTKYADTIEIKAGIFTPLVWLFAEYFYRHRQRRWKELALELNHTQ